MGYFLMIAGFVGVPVCLVVLIVKAIRKKKLKTISLIMAGLFVCFAAGIILAPQMTPEQRDAERLAKEQEEATLPSETPLVAGTSWTMSGVTPTSTSGEADNSFYEAETVSELMEDIVSDGIIEKLISFGFTSEEARDIRKTFIMCGVTNIDACEPADPATTIDGLVVFRGVLDKDRIFWFTVDHREVFYIALNGVDVYDKDKGGFLININDIHVPVSDVDQDTFYKLQDLATAAVDNYLKYPNSAYYDAWAVAREDNKYMIQGEVQARNALNAKDWLVFKVWFDDAGGDFTIEGIVIDGERVR